MAAQCLSLFPSLYAHMTDTLISTSSPSTRLLILMENQNNKKRASPVHSLPISTTKKRVVLGDLTNSPDYASNRNSIKKQPGGRLDPESSNTEIFRSPEDPQSSGYAASIYNHLRSLEMEQGRRSLPNYLERVQYNISVTMRAVLVDWLVEVAEEYKLTSDTLYLTVSYVDRFLSAHAIDKNRLQLLGISCMFTAAKYEEICTPHVEDFCYITDNTYTKEEVLDMERDVLKFLNFDMGIPTTKNFFRCLTRAAQVNCKESPNLQFELLGSYLTELSLLDYGCVRFLPSIVAASATFLSRFTIQPKLHPWNLGLQCYSGYKPSDLKECIIAIRDLQLNKSWSSLLAIRNKYNHHKFGCVATLSSPSEIPASYFEGIMEEASVR